MVIKYAAIKKRSYESGQIFIAPQMILADEVLAKDRAVFGAEAYKEEYVVLELRPIEVVK